MLHSSLSYFTGGLLFGWPTGIITALYVTRKYWRPASHDPGQEK